MARLLIITRPEASLGFRLGGFEGREVPEEEDPTTVIEKIERDGDYALVCIDKRILDGVGHDVLKRVRKAGFPVLIPLDMPGAWEEEAAAESPVARMIRRAIGYQIKIHK